VRRREKKKVALYRKRGSASVRSHKKLSVRGRPAFIWLQEKGCPVLLKKGTGPGGGEEGDGRQSSWRKKAFTLFQKERDKLLLAPKAEGEIGEGKDSHFGLATSSEGGGRRVGERKPPPREKQTPADKKKGKQQSWKRSIYQRRGTEQRFSPSRKGGKECLK